MHIDRDDLRLNIRVKHRFNGNYSPLPPEVARVPYQLIPVASERAAPPSRSGRLSRPGRKVVTHFVGEGMLAHIFSLTSEDSSDST